MLFHVKWLDDRCHCLVAWLASRLGGAGSQLNPIANMYSTILKENLYYGFTVVPHVNRPGL